MSARGVKTRLVKARVDKQMKQAVIAYAREVGETEAVIVRESLAEYFHKRKINVGKRSLNRSS